MLRAKSAAFQRSQCDPSAPNSSSILKYVDYPVSYFSGTPNISFPFFTVKTQQLEVPVSLSYHASGLKVEEYSSWVGAGWTLNAGGVVSRNIRGLPDELLDDRKGFYHNLSVVLSNGTFSGSALNDCSVTNALLSETPVNTPDSVARGLLDTEPDLYTLSAPGIQDKFHISKTGGLVHYQANDLAYTSYPFSNPTQIPNGGGAAYQWVVMGENGVSYKFSSVEKVTTNSNCGGAKSPYESPLTSQNSWQLDEMSIGDEWIRFEYVGEIISYPMTISESKTFKVYGNGAQQTNSTCINTNVVQGKRLSRIYSSNGYEVLFSVHTSNLRNDLSGSKKLDKVTMRFNGIFLSAYELTHSYFGSNAKLKLDKITQINENGVPLNAGQQYEYFNSASVPALTSKSQDYWGYFNGVTQSSLIPVYKDNLFHFNKISAANRLPSINNARVGTLSKIIHATGGRTEFEYELHNYYDAGKLQDNLYQASSQNQNLVSTNFTVSTQCSATIETDLLTEGPLSYTRFKKWNGSSYMIYTPASAGAFSNRLTLPAGQYRLEAYSESTQDLKFIKVEFEQVVPGHVDVGGLRIKKIKHIDPLTSQSLVRVFDYTDAPSGNSSGKLFRAPLFGGNLTTYASGQLSTQQGVPVACLSDALTYYLNVSAQSQIAMVIYSGTHIGYSNIKETVMDAAELQTSGFTRYEFINEKDNSVKSFPFTPDIDLGYKNGKPIKTEAFKILTSGSAELIQGTYYQYEEISLPGGITGLNFKQKATAYCYSCSASNFGSGYYAIVPKWHRTSTERTLTKEGLAETEVLKTYYYDLAGSHHYYVKQDILQNTGELYTEELERHSQFPALITKAETFFNTQKISGTRTAYTQTLPNYYETWNRKTSSYDRINDYTYNSWKLTKEQNYKPKAGEPTVRSYLWGNNSLPVAVISNANAADCSYNSFEDDVSSISTTAKAGAKSHVGTFQIILPTTGNFVVSYWQKIGSSDWVYVEQPTTVNLTIGSTGNLVDEVRVFPKTCKMKTFVYWPNGLIRSISDENGRINYFDFDPYGRLTHMLDTEMNITKKIQYFYKVN